MALTVARDEQIHVLAPAKYSDEAIENHDVGLLRRLRLDCFSQERLFERLLTGKRAVLRRVIACGHAFSVIVQNHHRTDRGLRSPSENHFFYPLLYQHTDPSEKLVLQLRGWIQIRR